MEDEWTRTEIVALSVTSFVLGFTAALEQSEEWHQAAAANPEQRLEAARRMRAEIVEYATNVE